MKMQKMKHEITEIAPNTWCLSEFRLVRRKGKGRFN